MPRTVAQISQCPDCRRVMRIHARNRCASCYHKAREAGLPTIIRVPLPPCRRCGVPVAKRSYVYCADCRAVVLAAYRAGRPVPPLGRAPVEQMPAPPPLPARKHRHDRATAAIWHAGAALPVGDDGACSVVELVGPDIYAEAIRVVAAWGED